MKRVIGEGEKLRYRMRKKIIFCVFMFLCMFFICVFSVDAAFDESKLGTPTITGITSNSDSIIISFKSNAPADVCKSVNCGIMLYEGSTDRIYRLSNSATSYYIKNLLKGKTYTFSIAQYYINDNGVYKNTGLKEKKTITFGSSSTVSNLTCAFEGLPNVPLAAGKSSNVYVVCTARNGEKLKNYKAPSSKKITLSSNSYGSYSAPVYISPSKSGTETKYKYRIKYTATKTKNKVGSIKINVLKGFVETTSGTQNASLSSGVIKVDTKPPVIKVTKNMRKPKDGYYKVSESSPLKITFSCDDNNFSKMAIYRNGSRFWHEGTSTKKVTITSAAGLDYECVCYDKAGNKISKEYSYKTYSFKPAFISIFRSNYNQIKFNYKTTGDGIQIYNVTQKKTVRTTSAKTYTYLTVPYGKTQKYKIRSYVVVGGKKKYSSYSNTLSMASKIPVPSTAYSCTKSYHKITYKLYGSTSGVQIKKGENGKIKNYGKTGVKYKNGKSGTYQYYIRSYYKKSGKTYYSDWVPEGFSYNKSKKKCIPLINAYVDWDTTYSDGYF